MTNDLYKKSCLYLKKLCREIKDRSVGSRGNRQATKYFVHKLVAQNWNTTVSELKVVDWEERGATLTIAGHDFKVFASPYSKGCEMQRILKCAETMTELEEIVTKDKIILLRGQLAREQIMPKNFTFYNPDRHQKIISLLEKKQPAAIITATGRNSSIAGGVYPFPMFEDGDFAIPSVYMTDKEGTKLSRYIDQTVQLKSNSRRIPARAYNVIAKKGKNSDKKVVVSAHIDAKKGSPGAIDNATGVIILLLLAQLLKDYNNEPQVEIVALNGEDYYSVPGQMDYINKNQEKFNKIGLNINIDGAGYIDGKSEFSYYNLPAEIERKVAQTIKKYNGIQEGPQWPQGDHSIFIQQGCPALAISSQWLIENIDTQTITHTKKDDIEIVDCHKLVEVAEALSEIISVFKINF